jgi:protein TIF31
MDSPSKEPTESPETPNLEEEEVATIKITIVTPAKEELKITVTPNEQIQEIRQYLLDEIATCVYTSYHFEHAGKVVKEDQPELAQAIPDVKDGSVLTMVEDAYSDYESRAQLIRVRDLLRLSQRSANEQLVASADLSNPDFNLEGLKADSADSTRDTVLLSAYYTGSQDTVKCLRALNYSGFNPPPATRRLMGDFYYLDFSPLETELASVVICANTRGFYVTQSKQGKFNPSAASKPCHSSTLSGCLAQYSAKFKKSFDEALEQHQAQAIQEHGAVPFPPNAWLAKSAKTHEFDLGRSEQDLMRFTETAVTAVMQGRDWNEEMQSARELPKQTAQERVTRDRVLYRIHAEYVDAATTAAISIVHGQIQPLNPSDNPTSWIYVHNNIFFTQATDMRGLYADCGGDETFEKSVSNDLVALKRVNELDPSDIYPLDNLLIRYCGKTLFAQTIIPGLFNGLVAGETPIVYGALEGQGVAFNEELHSKLAKIAPLLHLKEHKVLSASSNSSETDESNTEKTENAAAAAASSKPVTLFTSADIKGIVGTDNRSYLLDLGHLFPRDANYSSDMNPTAVYRPELLQSYVTRQWYQARTRAFATRTAELAKQKKEAEEKGEKFEIPEDLGIPDIQVPTLQLNSDLYVKGVTLADTEEVIAADKELNAKLGRFLTDEVIVMLLNDWASSHAPLPLDTQTLTNTMHARGINMRYLGRITTSALRVVPAVRDVLYREMIVRSAQTAFRALVHKVPSYSMGEFVVSFLNAFFDKVSTAGKGSRSGVKPVHLSEAQAAASLHQRDDEFGLSHQSLWVSIRAIVEAKYNYTLPEFIPGGVFELATLRSLCLRLGLKLEAKNFDFNKDRPFELSNLIEMVPVVKHVAPTSRDGYQLLAAGKSLAAEGKEESIEVFQEALSLYHQTFGAMYREIGSTFSNLAMLSFQDDPEQAVQFMERAVYINEKTLGPDHHDTIHSYGNLATVLAAIGEHKVALNYLRRALYLGILVAGWNHPENVSTYQNIAVVMHDQKEFKESLTVLGKAQKILDHLIAQTPKDTDPKLDLAINALNYAHSATISHLLATAHAGCANYREALIQEKNNYNILKQMLVSEDDPRVVEANTWLNELTRRAVEAEKSAKSQIDVTARLGSKKGINSKILKTAMSKAGSAGIGGNAASIQIPSVTMKRATPSNVIGKQASANNAASSSSSSSAKGANASAKASSSAKASPAASSSAPVPSGKAKNTGKKSASSAPVPDLL